MFGASVKTGKTLVTIVAAADPTGLVVAGAVLDTAIHAYDELAKKHPDLGKLAKEAQKKFDDALKTPAYDKPDNARILLPQMLEYSWRHADFTGAGLNASKMIDAMLAAVPAGPDIREVHRTAFRNLFGPILQTLCDDPRLTAVINPQLWQEQFRRQEADSAKLDTHTQLLEALLDRLGGVEATLANVDALGIDDMRALATRFGEPEMTDKAEIVKFLTLKAEEYRTYKAQIDGLDERVAALGNLKGAAQDAAERLDFDTVEEFLARVTEVEAVIFAESCETRARNAFLRGQVDQAATILTAGADALAVIDPSVPEQLKAAGFMDIPYKHGLRYGGRGLACSLAMVEDALKTLTCDRDPQSWAKAQGNLTNALAALASRSNGEQATILLTRAIESNDEALSALTRADHPVDWAITQQNLATALATLAKHSDGEEATALLTRTIMAFEEVLTVATRADHPLDWAMPQQNLASALGDLATHGDAKEATALLTRAITAFEEALTVRTRVDHPVDWAMTQ